MPPFVPAAPFYSILQDDSGNMIGITLDGGVYRIEQIGKIRNSAGILVNPSTEDTLATRSSEATLATRLSEATGLAVKTVLTAIRDTAGIKKITDSLPTGNNLIGKAIVSDGTNDAVVTAAGLLKVEATPSAGSSGVVQIESGDGSGDRATVDSSKRLQVQTAPPAAPPGSAAVSITAQSEVNGNTAVDTDYTVPDTKVLTITQFFGGGETDGKKSSKFELWHSTDGGATDGSLLAFGYIGGGNNFRVDLNVPIIGSGTNVVIRMRRERLSGGSKELAARWEGSVTN